MTKVDVINGVVINSTGYITLIEGGNVAKEFGTPRDGNFVRYWVDLGGGAELKQLFNNGGSAVYWPSGDKEKCAQFIAKRYRVKYYGKESVS